MSTLIRGVQLKHDLPPPLASSYEVWLHGRAISAVLIRENLITLDPDLRRRAQELLEKEDRPGMDLVFYAFPDSVTISFNGFPDWEQLANAYYEGRRLLELELSVPAGTC